MYDTAIIGDKRLFYATDEFVSMKSLIIIDRSYVFLCNAWPIIDIDGELVTRIHKYIYFI